MMIIGIFTLIVVIWIIIGILMIVADDRGLFTLPEPVFMILIAPILLILNILVRHK